MLLRGMAGAEVQSSCCDRCGWLKSIPARFFPPAAGKLLTGHEFGGDAKKYVDAGAKMIDAKTKDASLL